MATIDQRFIMDSAGSRIETVLPVGGHELAQQGREQGAPSGEAAAAFSPVGEVCWNLRP